MLGAALGVLAPRIGDVGEHHGWAAEDVVLEFDAVIDGHIVLDFDVVADDDALAHADVLAQGAVAPDARPALDVRKVPDSGAIADVNVVVHEAGFVNEVVSGRSGVACIHGVFGTVAVEVGVQELAWVAKMNLAARSKRGQAPRGTLSSVA